jgi:hypothetical protein
MWDAVSKSQHISAHFRLTVSLMDKLNLPFIYRHSSYEDWAYGHVGIRKNWVFSNQKTYCGLKNEGKNFYRENS